MKWPFVRHANTTTPRFGATSGDTGSTRVADQTRLEAPGRGTDEVTAPSRREWTTLPPLQVAGGRPISLTAATRAFTEGLASRQVLVRLPRLEHVRQLDAPSGSFRGVLSPALDDEGSTPELQAPSALPPIEHRQLAPLSPEHGDNHGLSPIEQLLALGETGDRGATPMTRDDAVVAPRTEVDDEPDDRGGTPGRRPGLADSRRRGLGPAYHGPLPEAMRAERERGAEEIVTEAVPGDMRTTMRDMLGIDVGDRLVHRGPAVSAEARAMGAQAFTRDGEVHVADDVGPLDQARGRSTLAHELTHAAQQIVHGIVPDETTLHGEVMEAHAQQVEQYVRGDAAAAKPGPEMLHARPAPNTDSGNSGLISNTRKMMRELVDSGVARSDGAGGIVFTMPPSAMTGTAGAQRLTTTAPTAGEAARQENWSGAAVFGNTLAQGLGNDLLGMAGSLFGFSDEFMGEQRGELADADREFRRQQTRQAFTDLRMEHLRTAELQRINAAQVNLGRDQFTSLDEETLRNIESRVTTEVDHRMEVLGRQTLAALDELNATRARTQQPALHEIPDESFDVAFHRLFDDPDLEELPSDDELKNLLMRPAPSAGARPSGRPGGATPPGAHPSSPGGTSGTTGAPTGSATSHMTGAPGSSTGAGAHHTTPGSGTAPGAPGGHATEQPEQTWRTADTMRGRFEGLGTALVGDIASAEVGFFGSLLGFDEHFEDSLHAEIHPGHADAAGTTTAAHGGTDAAHGAAAHTGAAHGDAARHASPAAHETVDHIVGDPYALDELANRLYPNIRTRLRQELLVDRERAGLLADFR